MIGLAWGLLLLASGCQGEPGFVRVEGRSFFTPATLDFEVRALDEAHELTTVLRNASADRIQVTDIRFEPPQEVYAALVEDGTLRGQTLAPGQVVEITLVYRPVAEGTYDATMVVTAGNLDLPLEIPLEIKAEARRVPPARPEVSPGEVHFALTELGRDAVQAVQVKNAGELTGILAQVVGRAPFTVTMPGGGALSLPSVPLGPGETLDLEIHYQPTAPGLAQDDLRFTMSSGESVTVAVVGEAVTPGTLACDSTVVELGAIPRGERRRQAVRCEATGGPYTVETVRLADGSARYFSLIPEQPVMVQGVLQFEVEFDGVGLPGHYDGAVEILPLHRQRTQIALTADVAPPPTGTADLEVELIWNTGNSDFDLHLVRDAGRPFESGRDCFFEDKNPDWGTAGYPGDDPLLTTDDVNGFGPEYVSFLYAPEGTYDLWVQFYGYDQDVPPATMVRITYQLQGQGPVQYARALLECGVAWDVGRFTFDANGNATFALHDRLVMDFQGRASPECR
ncbi:MAG: choice-of-anchor D domain-containing protein [Deltaproteobacteria bacterium]|nr:choice-of-anchor D domain-containing protein [Deltaproteobacteria bacterium]